MKTSKRFLAATVSAVTIFAATSAMAASVLIGSPADPGTGNCFPFGCSSGTEYQQVYNSALFGSTMVINDISFFNTQFNPGGAIIDTADYAISLSTTSMAVNGLDTSNLANNIGADNTLFFSGLLGGPIGGTTFTIAGSGFTYNPANGNLLIDIVKTNDQGNGNAYLDARNGTFGTDSSRAHNFGSAFESWGLVTEFTTTNAPVPEPSTLLLLGSGMTGLVAMRRFAFRK